MNHRIYYDAPPFRGTEGREARYLDITLLPGAWWPHRLRHYRWLRRTGMSVHHARLTFWREYEPRTIVSFTVETGARPAQVLVDA